MTGKRKASECSKKPEGSAGSKTTASKAATSKAATSKAAASNPTKAAVSNASNAKGKGPAHKKKRGNGGVSGSSNGTRGEKKEEKEVKLNFTRLESLMRMMYLMFHFTTRAWVLEHAEGWCKQHSWYPGEFYPGSVGCLEEYPSWDMTEMPEGLERQMHHISLLSLHVPGFKAVWFHYELDLKYAVWPFWCWEEGDPIPLIEALPYIATYLAFYARPTLTKVALIMLQQMLHYSNVSEEGRPDLLVLIFKNCMYLNERLIELHHSSQSRDMSWNGVRTIDHFARNGNLMAARKDLKERALWARRAHVTERMSQIRLLHDRLVTGPKNGQTRDLMIEREKEEFTKAASGQYPGLASAPVKIEEGYDVLVGGGKFSVASMDTALDAAAELIDPLLGQKLTELKTFCAEENIDLVAAMNIKKAAAAATGGPAIHHSLLKVDLVKLLREADHKPKTEDIPDVDKLRKH